MATALFIGLPYNQRDKTLLSTFTTAGVYIFKKKNIHIYSDITVIMGNLVTAYNSKKPCLGFVIYAVKLLDISITMLFFFN